MAIQIIPNLEAQKSAKIRQNRMEGIGQALQGFAEFQEKKGKQAKTSEAFKKMGIPEEIQHLPEEAQKLAYKQYFKEEMSEKDKKELEKIIAQTEASKALTKQREEKTRTMGSQDKLFNKMFPIDEDQGVKSKEGEILPGEPESKFAQGILKPESEVKPKDLKPKGMKSESKKPFNLADAKTWSDEQVDTAAAFAGQEGNAGTYGTRAKAERERRDKEVEKKEKQAKEDIERTGKEKLAKRSEFESDRTFHSKTSDPIVAESDAILQSAPVKRGLMNQQRVDIASGNTTGLLPFLVEKTGAEAWRNPESARFKTIAKEQFIESLNTIGGGARPNQFIEQQLSVAQPSIGRDAEANQTVLDLLEFKDDLTEHRAKLIRDIAQQDRKELGYVKNDVAQRADDKMADYVEKRQEQMAYDIRRRKEEKMSDQDLTADIVLGKVTPGTPLTLRAARILMIKNGDDEKKAMAEAKKHGFVIPSETTYMRGMK